MTDKNPAQRLITEIERANEVRLTMMERLEKHGEIFEKTKKYLREHYVRPYAKKPYSRSRKKAAKRSR